MASFNPQSDASPDLRHGPRGAAWWLPWLVTCLIFLAVEIAGRRGDVQTAGGSLGPILAADPDALVWLALLANAPLLWWVERRGLVSGRLTRNIGLALRRAWERSGAGGLRPACLSILVGAVSLLASVLVGAQFDDLPPAYHDEYSYLFQAETFLAGRVSYPSHPAARLFDQMHVLNEGRFASRYFPGAGLWMAPFVAAGHPYWGQWLAGALCAVFMFWIARELAGDVAGLIAGLLTGLSPGMALFSNLLVAHHPTLVGLGLFLLGYLRMIRHGSRAWGFASGVGLAFAMLCRPLTAAGVALPFGMYLVVWAWRAAGGRDTPGVGAASENLPASALRRRIESIAALAAPLAIAAAGLFCYDRAITGSGWLTPYTLYTDIYTPRHVYGFNNVVRGERRLGPRVVENYDKWAENLTLEMAVENEKQRLLASSIWALGIVPLALCVSAGLVLWRQVPRGAWLLLAGIGALHAAYFPYWYVGIDYYHYVFESLPLWAAWTGVVSVLAARGLASIGRPLLASWWGSVLASAVVMNFCVCGGIWSAPLSGGINQLLFARRKHANFEKIVAERARPVPALVLVEPDPSDRHIDYVTNSPDLGGPVLIGRYLPDQVPIAEVKRLFPDRTLFLYRARDESWSRIE